MSDAKTASDLTPAPWNPRTITERELAQLGAAMRRYGDLSGIVYNRRSGTLVGGHQRVRHLPPAAEVVITERFEEPTDVGTVAEGHVLLAGERWRYREVDWDAETERAANVAANKIGGEWERGALVDLLDEYAEAEEGLRGTGFTADEYGALLAEIERTGRPLPEEAANDPDAEWEGMPAYEHEDKRPFRSLHVHFRNEEDVNEFRRLIGQQFADAATWIWHPRQRRNDFMGEQWVGEDAA